MTKTANREAKNKPEIKLFYSFIGTNFVLWGINYSSKNVLINTPFKKGIKRMETDKDKNIRQGMPDKKSGAFKANGSKIKIKAETASSAQITKAQSVQTLSNSDVTSLMGWQIL